MSVSAGLGENLVTVYIRKIPATITVLLGSKERLVVDVASPRWIRKPYELTMCPCGEKAIVDELG